MARPVPVAAGSIVQVLSQGVIENQLVENVWYFRPQAADTDMLLHLLTAISQCLITSLLPVLSPAYALERLVGTIVGPAVGAQAIWYPEGGESLAGEGAGDSMPSFVSAVVSLHTERPGRSGRGRIYFTGIPEGQAIKSVITQDSPLHAGLIAFLACMLTTFQPKDVPVAGDYEWGVLSRKIGGLKPPFNTTGFAPIVDAIPNRELGTTRSRKIGRGR